MEIIKNTTVPTGNILVVSGELGKLECLSLGDYGKEINLNQHKKVEHTNLLPLSKKWVCTISTQYGCSMNCKFCDVPIVGLGKNATRNDLVNQVKTVLSLHPEIKESERLNIHYARMGEPTWNWNVLYSAMDLKKIFPTFFIHPVVSTMMPKKNKKLFNFLNNWSNIKNAYYNGEAGLQLSINSTDPLERLEMFSGNSMDIYDISSMMKNIQKPEGRKYTLNFAIAGYKIDAYLLAKLFDTKYFVCKITPMHKTKTAIENDIKTNGDYTDSYPYEEDEKNLINAGFDVLVFIASKEEDESRITCGNAIL